MKQRNSSLAKGDGSIYMMKFRLQEKSGSQT